MQTYSGCLRLRERRRRRLSHEQATTVGENATRYKRAHLDSIPGYGSRMIAVEICVVTVSYRTKCFLFLAFSFFFFCHVNRTSFIVRTQIQQQTQNDVCDEAGDVPQSFADESHIISFRLLFSILSCISCSFRDRTARSLLCRIPSTIFVLRT